MKEFMFDIGDFVTVKWSGKKRMVTCRKRGDECNMYWLNDKDIGGPSYIEGELELERKWNVIPINGPEQEEKGREMFGKLKAVVDAEDIEPDMKCLMIGVLLRRVLAEAKIPWSAFAGLLGNDEVINAPF